MEALAQAQPNIALVKYWGKRDAIRNIPAVGSLSITLDALWTRTHVLFDPTLNQDQFILNRRTFTEGRQFDRAGTCLELLRQQAHTDCRARVDTENNFPAGAGLASSASGFAALVTAAAAALGLKLDARERSLLARHCSGSAARSMFGGFVEMAASPPITEVVAAPLLDPEEWPLDVLIAITSTRQKAVGSTAGMNLTADTSDYYEAWVRSAPHDLDVARRAVLARDFAALAAVSERSCLKMHGLMLSADPGLVYWNGATVECIHRIRALREAGASVFFTIDAGPQVKAVCLPDYAAGVRAALGEVPGVTDVMTSGLGAGAKLLQGQM